MPRQQLGIQASLCAIAFSVLLGCGGSSPAAAPPSTPVQPKGSRILAIDAFYGATLPSNLQAAKAVGAQSVTQLVTWTMIETSPGTYDVTVLQGSGTLLPQQSLSLSLMVAVINTTVKDVPSDLTGLNFDDPTMIARFETLLDHVFAALPNTQLVSLGIGNEVDAYLNTPTLWSQYDTFYKAVADYARTKRPGVRVGVEATFNGTVGAAKAQLTALTQNSDVAMVSYYPVNGDFSVKDPSTVGTDLDALVAAYPGLAIEIREAGYPTSSMLNSSNDLQTTFVNNMFSAWDSHAVKIEYVCFTRLNDLTDAAVAADAKYYNTTDPRFLAYLQTLGLRLMDGTEKPAFAALRSDAQARGW